MAKVEICTHDKAYRDLYLKAEGFVDGLENNWREKAKNLTEAQKTVISALGCGEWVLEIDDDGSTKLILR